MFPLRWDFPFRKKDGSLSTISAEIEGGGGGGYTLPTASASTKGGIKVGENLTMTGEFLDADEQLPTYTSAEEGKVLSVDAEGELEWTTPGGGGSSVHLFYVTTNTYALAKIMVLTSESSITNFATLKSAIANGIVTVLDGTEPSNKGYVTTAYTDGSAIKARYVYYSSDSTSVSQSTLSISSISTVTATQIF